MKSLHILILCLTMVAISCSRNSLDVHIEEEDSTSTPNFESYYDSCSLNKYPPFNLQYVLELTDDRGLALPIDSVVWVKSGGGKIGSRSNVQASWLFWDDINRCHNLGFFDHSASNGNETELLPAELNFSNFSELRHFRSRSIVTNKHLLEIFSTAKDLKGIDIAIIEDIPEEICDCTELEYLTVFNFGEGKLPSCLKNLQSLKFLEIIGANNVDLGMVCDITSLQALFLDGGEYLAIPSSIANLNRLKHLRVSNVDSIYIPMKFNNMDSLEILEISGVEKKIEYYGQFENLKTLRALSMTNVSMNQFPLLQNSSDLCYLTAEFIHSLDTYKLDFSNKKALHTLKLSGTAFSEIDSFPKGIDHLENMRILYLCNFAFVDVPLYINKLAQLRDLNLTGANLGFTSLKMIYDINGPLRKNGLRSFQARQGILTNEQQEEIQRLKNQGSSLNGQYLDDFLPSFDYYMFKLKYLQEKYRGY